MRFLPFLFLISKHFLHLAAALRFFYQNSKRRAAACPAQEQPQTRLGSRPVFFHTIFSRFYRQTVLVKILRIALLEVRILIFHSV